MGGKGGEVGRGGSPSRLPAVTSFEKVVSRISKECRRITRAQAATRHAHYETVYVHIG